LRLRWPGLGGGVSGFMMVLGGNSSSGGDNNNNAKGSSMACGDGSSNGNKKDDKMNRVRYLRGKNNGNEGEGEGEGEEDIDNGDTNNNLLFSANARVVSSTPTANQTTANRENKDDNSDDTTTAVIHNGKQPNSNNNNNNNNSNNNWTSQDDLAMMKSMIADLDPEDGLLLSFHSDGKEDVVLAEKEKEAEMLLSSSLPLRPICEATGLYYPSTPTMKLLSAYDDGLILDVDHHNNEDNHDNNNNNNGVIIGNGNNIGIVNGDGIDHDDDHDGIDDLGMDGLPPVATSTTSVPIQNSSVNDSSVATNENTGEPVFCRICREGLHDIDDDTATAHTSHVADASPGNSGSGGSGNGGGGNGNRTVLMAGRGHNNNNGSSAASYNSGRTPSTVKLTLNRREQHQRMRAILGYNNNKSSSNKKYPMYSPTSSSSSFGQLQQLQHCDNNLQINENEEYNKPDDNVIHNIGEHDKHSSSNSRAPKSDSTGRDGPENSTHNDNYNADYNDFHNKNGDDSDHVLADMRNNNNDSNNNNNIINNEDEPHHHRTSPVGAIVNNDITTTTTSKIVPHHPCAENPLLAPCECSGSMAFVHYLCVEQWRCRSNHPAARSGLNCETCFGAYTLPPPKRTPRQSSSQRGMGENADWMEAMPPHVLEALRRPHLWWRLGAAIVRRRWLRPIAPILMSPIVALYCRARRMLKKTGVSRRRWACSLCRRRARWKCVRCLRSYYCSRQCQNVSWHIVHKHVCYKPARFWWSMAFYGVGLVLLFPGIRMFPAIYDIGLSLLLASFMVMGVIGGGVATIMKKVVGVDIRGRGLELIVVMQTLLLANVSWGLVWGFFGDVSQCWGVTSLHHPFLQYLYTLPKPPFSSSFGDSSNDALLLHSIVTNNNKLDGSTAVFEDLVTGDGSSGNNDLKGPILNIVRMLILRPGKVGIGMIDGMARRTGPYVTPLICAKNHGTSSTDTTRDSCLRMARVSNPDFFLSEYGGEKCASDINTVVYVWMFAIVVFFGVFLLKMQASFRRVAVRQRQHQHQD